MDLTVGRIVWARQNKDDIYWPGKITIISNNSWTPYTSSDLFSNHFQMQYNYLVHFFVTNQSIWINDILPYHQYRDSMTNNSFIHYGLHPTVKQDFLNAINQADYASSNEIYANNENLTSMSTMISQQQKVVPTIEDNNIDNDFLLTPSPMLTSNTGYYTSPLQQTSTPPSNLTIQSTDTSNIFTANSNNTNEILTTNNDWYSQQGLLIESITPPLPTTQNDNEMQHISSSDNFQKTNSVTIITTKTYSNSSFISYLFNCLFTFYHRSIFYIDELTNYQHPNTSNISYFICLDHFDTTIKQILDTTILNNLNVHINYLFLVINAPSNLLITHLYSTIMDKRTILILHYHSTFDNDPLLLCSGDRTTFKMIESSLLKYLCSKIKYIESPGNNVQEGLYSAYCISSIIQSTNVLNHFVNEQVQQTLNEKFELDFLRNNQNILNELFPQLSISKSTNQNNLLQFVHNSNEDILKNKSKQLTIMNDLFQSGTIQTNICPPICEYYVQNVLNDK